MKPAPNPTALLLRLAAAGLMVIVAQAVGAADAAAQEPEIPMSEQPLYGTAPKDSDVVEADRRLLQRIIDRGKTSEQVFKAAIRVGWDAYRTGEFGIAMRRFNQAWLLNPDDGQVYWGLGVTVEARDGDLERAAALLGRARRLLPQDADLLVDSARLLGRMDEIEDSIELYEEALELDPDLSAAHQGLAISYARKGYYRNALRHAERAEAGGASLPESIMEQLRTRAR